MAAEGMDAEECIELSLPLHLLLPFFFLPSIFIVSHPGSETMAKERDDR